MVKGSITIRHSKRESERKLLREGRALTEVRIIVSSRLT